MNSPFNQEQVELLNRLLPTLTESQQTWLSGYMSALNRTSSPVTSDTNLPVVPVSAEVVSAVSQPVISKDVTVLFGSQTGNGQRLAKNLSGKLEAQGFQVTLSSMSDFKP